MFGCDVCQDVCPWNVKFARPTSDPELAPREDVVAPDLAELVRLSDETFTHRYGDTPLARPGPAGTRRNAAAVLANRERSG